MFLTLATLNIQEHILISKYRVQFTSISVGVTKVFTQVNQIVSLCMGKFRANALEKRDICVETAETLRIVFGVIHREHTYTLSLSKFILSNEIPA